MQESWALLAALESDVYELMHDTGEVEAVSGIPNSPFTTHWNFADVQLAELICTYWKLRIIFYRIMVLLDIDVDQRDAHTEIALDAAMNICQTFEYARSLKPLGSWFMVFSLPIAAWVMHETLQLWIQSSLRELTDAGHSFNLGNSLQFYVRIMHM